MPTYIVKLHDKKENKDYYLEWSTIVDAPLTYGMDLETFKKYYLIQHGESSIASLEERLQRVEKNGTSGYPPFDILKELLSVNRAGDRSGHLSKEGILAKYCRNIEVAI